ncbi:DUF6412 domain-containing protein [Streptomyces sp. NPDC086091]|uniref:DUF6412 domain-containing protein n=1 Tax=Streptomyces sp. NPDC086091 TaxID=3365751 RepID=UPI0038161DA1
MRSDVVRSGAMRSAVVRLLPLVLLGLLLLGCVLLDAGGLGAAGAVALAATSAAAAALLLSSLAAARAVPAVAPTRVRTALRDRDRRTAFLPQRDPDAAGRPRPRAPGHALPTTVAGATGAAPRRHPQPSG